MSTISHVLSSVEFGNPVHVKNLSMFPLLLVGEPPAGYLTLDEALAQDWAKVTEVSDSGSVPTLAARVRRAHARECRDDPRARAPPSRPGSGVRRSTRRRRNECPASRSAVPQPLAAGCCRCALSEHCVATTGKRPSRSFSPSVHHPSTTSFGSTHNMRLPQSQNLRVLWSAWTVQHRRRSIRQ
jgi:hypothetical protein